MKSISAALILMTIVLGTMASANDQARFDAATAYLESPVQQKLLNDMLSVDGVMAQMGLFAGRLPKEQEERLVEIVAEELSSIRSEMEKVMIEGMAATFTLDEINALNAFYSSDVGASAMSKMQPFMAKTMGDLGPTFQRMQANLTRRVQAELGRK